MRDNAGSATPKALSPAVSRYEIWMADIPVLKDSRIQYGRRPVVIVSNNEANCHSPVITAVPLASRLNKRRMPTHVYLEGQGLDRESIALCEQVTALDKGCLLRRMGIVYKPFERIALCHALTVQLGFHSRLDKVA